MLLNASRNWLGNSLTARLVLIVSIVLAVTAPVRSANARPRVTHAAFVISEPQEDGWALIKTDDGALFVWNRADIHLTLGIKGKNIKPLNDPEHIFFDVDGLVFQIQMAAMSEFADTKEKKLDDKAILAAHRDWETKFLEGLLGKTLKVQVFSGKLSTGSEASLWQYDMEGINAEAKKQVYLTVVSKPYVLLLNGAATAASSDEVVRKFLMDTMATLKISSTPIDVKKLSESMRKSAGQ